MALDILDCLALHEGADPLAACERVHRERDCRALRLAIERRLCHRDAATGGELRELLAVLPAKRLEQLLRRVGEGCCAKELCDDVGIPASRQSAFVDTEGTST